MGMPASIEQDAGTVLHADWLVTDMKDALRQVQPAKLL